MAQIPSQTVRKQQWNRENVHSVRQNFDVPFFRSYFRVQLYGPQRKRNSFFYIASYFVLSNVFYLPNIRTVLNRTCLSGSRGSSHTLTILPNSQQTIILSSTNKLSQFADDLQLPEELGGTLPYNHDDWLQRRTVSRHL